VNDALGIHVACNLCGADEPETLYDALPLVRCRRCGLAYVDPQPSDEALAAVYGEDYFTTPTHAGEPSYIENREGLEGFFLGYLLHVAERRGWTAVGLELSDFAARYAREHFSVDIRVARLEDAGLEAGSFDAVVMRDVLEHVRDPRGFLQAARHVLRPDGILALSMPNFASLNALLGGPAWRHLHPEQHLFQFAPRTIDRLLDKCGFEAIEMTSRYDSPATREVYAALTAPAERRRLALHAALRGDIVFLPLGTTLRRLLRAAAVGLSLAALPFRDRLSDDILEVHARRLST